MTWWNDYIGIPYAERGRDRSGLDCWGLVRLVHAEVFGHDLPALLGDYETTSDRARLTELVARERESWEPAGVPQSGDVVVFRVLGQASHVGIVTQPGYFLHVRSGHTSCIERLDAVQWRDRIDGVYRYTTATTEITVAACPHPLRTERIDTVMPPGLTVSKMLDQLRAQTMPKWGATVWVNGREVSREDWDHYIPPPGSRVEMRVVAGDDNTIRLIAVVAIIVVAAYVAPSLAASMGITSTAGIAGVQAGLVAAGTLLVNAIFPVRIPDQRGADRGADRQLLLQGGQNQASPYGAIPVVLGRFRYTPPLGAVTYSESSATQSFLRMAMVWGYGPLQVTDLRIGDVALTSYEEVTYETLAGESGESMSRFDSIYGRDVEQLQIGALLVCPARKVLTASRSSNLVSCTTALDHEYSVGAVVRLFYQALDGSGVLQTYDISGPITSVPSPTSFVFSHTGANQTFSADPFLHCTASSWTERVLDEEVDQISVTLHFPEGLRQMALEGDSAGKIYNAFFRGRVEVRQLDSETLAPITGWGDISRSVVSQTFSVGPAFYNVDTDQELEPVYRWTRFSLDEYGNIIRRDGAVSESQTTGPSASLLTRLQAENFGLNVTFDRLPAYADGEEGLWDVCVFGDTIVQTVNRRDASVTGCALTHSGRQVTIASGSVERAESETLLLGWTNEPYAKRKDAFTLRVNFAVARGKYEVRVRRTSDSLEDVRYGGVLTGLIAIPDSLRPEGTKGRRFHACYLQTITGYSTRRPMQPPSPLAMTALRIRATNQLNGSIDGISGTVTSICPDYDSATGTWVTRPTRNPASLMRWVLQHPANAQRVADSKIDLAALADWHTFCRTNGFTFDAVLSEQRSLWDVLSDVAAAGRASPTMRDGKWTVVIDRPRTLVAQHFTPHNSWGFQGVRALPKLPHAFRVQFNNANRAYQPDERIVYNDGYSASNATAFEGLTLPGVTSPDVVFKQSRFHLAQLKLRPETYTLNADIEHLICTRGDLVRVTHDVPMWGLGSARIRTRISDTVLELDETMPMDAGVQYTLRIRAVDGSSVTRTVEAAATDGHYSTLTLTSAVTTAQAAPGDLVMFGSLSSESVELVVQSIEPAENMTARLTLVDYSPAVYDSDSEVIPAFDSQITLPPTLLQYRITQTPTITELRSDESVLIVMAGGSYNYGMRVSIDHPSDLPERVISMQAEIDFANDGRESWQDTQTVPLSASAVTFYGLEEGAAYVVRVRYVDDQGRTSPWVRSASHTVVGKTAEPSTPADLVAQASGTQVALSWTAAPEIDVVGYEVRTADSGWGVDAAYLYSGSATSCLVAAPNASSTLTYYVRAVDGLRLYSAASAAVVFNAPAVPNVAGITASFADTSLTNATVTLDWTDAAPMFGLAGYRVMYGTTSKRVSSNTVTLPADWIGNRSFTVITIDQRGNESSGTTTVVTKLAPNPVTNFRSQVIDNNVLLQWTLPAKTTLPVSHVLIKKGSTWAGAETIGTKDGAFTTLQEVREGTYTYWIAVVDTDGYESTPVPLTVEVAEPPDFVLNAEFFGDFSSGTKSSAIADQGALVLPVNTSETFAAHFTSRGWSTPADQIAAGYPIFIQPANGSGYYEEVFDYGTVLGSSKVTLTWTGEIVSGSPSVATSLSISSDGVSYTDYPGATSVFALAFRYVKVRVTVTEATGTGLYRLTELALRLDAKLKNDAGLVSAVSTDASGTVANFGKEFVDVTSITLTPSGTTPATAVYDFQDSVINGTYSVASNVATVNATAHGLVAGQAVRLAFGSGTAPSGVYTVASVTSANAYTVSITTANTSGSVSTYPQGFRVYCFNSAGTRISGSVSWSVKGY